MGKRRPFFNYYIDIDYLKDILYGVKINKGIMYLLKSSLR